MKKFLLNILICLIPLTAFSQDTSATLSSTIVQDSYFQTINRFYYRWGAINDQGIAYQNLKSPGKFDVWYQQVCWNAIVAGIGQGQEEDIRLGLKAIRYAFGTMKADGSLQSSSIAGMARFLLAFAKSYFEINQSKYREKYITELNSYKPKAKKAAYYILGSPQWAVEKEKISNYSNQIIGSGLTFKLIGAIAGDKKLIEYGNRLFFEGLNKQTAEGIFPEAGGYDSSYQAVSLQFAEFYYLYGTTATQKNSLFPILNKGWEWELTRIANSGEINASGNTRTGLKQEMWRGEFKGINYPEVAMSLVYWSYISAKRDFREVARNIFEYGLSHR